MRILVVLPALFVAVGIARADITTGDLLKSCDSSTLVMENVSGGKTEVVGETLDAYCKGYVEGHVSAMKGRICLKDRDTYFVISLLRHYVKAQPATSNQPAGETLSKALLRAYSCAPTAKGPVRSEARTPQS